MSKIFKIAFGDVWSRALRKTPGSLPGLPSFVASSRRNISTCPRQPGAKCLSTWRHKLCHEQLPCAMDKTQCVVRCAFVTRVLHQRKGGHWGGRHAAGIHLHRAAVQGDEHSCQHRIYLSIRNPDDLKSKGGYCLVILQSAVAFLSTVTSENLSGMSAEDFGVL